MGWSALWLKKHSSTQYSQVGGQSCRKHLGLVHTLRMFFPFCSRDLHFMKYLWKPENTESIPNSVRIWRQECLCLWWNSSFFSTSKLGSVICQYQKSCYYCINQSCISYIAIVLLFLLSTELILHHHTVQVLWRLWLGLRLCWQQPASLTTPGVFVWTVQLRWGNT